MNIFDVLRAPKMSEKTLSLKEEANQFAFEVDQRANKIQIKESVEKSILDKLGQNKVKLEKDGFTRGKWITYEEVINDGRPVHYETVLGVEWQHEHLKSGKHNIRMIEINRQIQDVIKEIIAKEFEEQTLQTKVNDAKPEVSIAT